MEYLCMPVKIFAAFVAIQIFIDLFTGYYNRSLMKLIFAVFYGLLVAWVCSIGAHLLAWLLIFIPFALFSLIIIMLLYFFKLKETTGVAKYEEEVTSPVIVLPNNQVIMPIREDNCIVITKVEPHKHGVRTKYKDTIFCQKK